MAEANTMMGNRLKRKQMLEDPEGTKTPKKPKPAKLGSARLRDEELDMKLKKYKHGGRVSSASKRADGAAQRGKTRGKFV